jgi:hypothetical protein
MDDNPAGTRVLLIGRRTSWGWSMITMLKELGCAVSFLTAVEEASRTTGLEEFDVILGGSDCNHALHRLPSLRGSHASVFYVYPVEDSCWWLPALNQGADCYGSVALRPAEFAAHLKQLLRIPKALAVGK